MSIPGKRYLHAALAAGILLVGGPALGQQADGQPVTGRSQAPVDLTGYWTAVVTEDWRWRMVTPPRGDYASVPLNDAGRRVADSWDGDDKTCKPYGAAGVMRMPLRLHITWEDDNTLRIDTDHAQQTRRFHFGDSAGSASESASMKPSLQGHSVASWKGNPGGSFLFLKVQPQLSYLQVVTDSLAPGYLRRNGVPYSAQTKLTEFYERHTDFGEDWLTITTVVNDPKYLTEEFITSSSFKRLPDGSDWHPTDCHM